MNDLLVAQGLLVFITFGIIGVEFFGGLLWRCESSPGTVLYGIDKAGCAAAGTT